jgi:xanthine/uracil permease
MTAFVAENCGQLQQTDAWNAGAACTSFGRSCSPAFGAFVAVISVAVLIGVGVVVWWSRKID